LPSLVASFFGTQCAQAYVDLEQIQFSFHHIPLLSLLYVVIFYFFLFDFW